MRAWCLLIVVSMLAGNVLPVERAHASAEDAIYAGFHLDGGADSDDCGSGGCDECDLCGQTCCQLAMITTLRIAASTSRPVAFIAPTIDIQRRAEPVPIKPPKPQLHG